MRIFDGASRHSAKETKRKIEIWWRIFLINICITFGIDGEFWLVERFVIEPGQAEYPATWWQPKPISLTFNLPQSAYLYVECFRSTSLLLQLLSSCFKNVSLNLWQTFMRRFTRPKMFSNDFSLISWFRSLAISITQSTRELNKKYFLANPRCWFMSSYQYSHANIIYAHSY